MGGEEVGRRYLGRGGDLDGVEAPRHRDDGDAAEVVGVGMDVDGR